MNNRFFSQAEVFVEIVRQGSLTAAAATLRMSKSNVSQKLAEMEAEMDVRLFDRSTRSLALTPAGQSLYDACAGAVDGVAQARAATGQTKYAPEPEGMVSISGPNIYLTDFVLPHLGALIKRHPRIDIRLLGSDRPVDQQRENVDIRIRAGALKTNSARVVPLQTLGLVLCGRPGFAINDPSHLADLPVVLREQEAPAWTFRQGDQTVTFQINTPKVRVSSYELCLTSVRQGLGCALVSQAVVQTDLDRGDLVNLLPNWNPEPINVSMVVPYARMAKPQVTVVMHYLRNALITK